MTYYANETSILIKKITAKRAEDIINSKVFLHVIKQFYNIYIDRIDFSKYPDFTLENIVLTYQELLKTSEFQNNLTTNYNDLLVDFGENLYDYYRKLNRYAVSNLKNTSLISTADSFNSLILETYRTIQQRIMKRNFLVYRQLPAGLNALFSICDIYIKDNNYQVLNHIPFITQCLIRPPFIVKTKSNKRVDYFKETKIDFLKNLEIKKDEFYCYPVYAGKLKAFVYCHFDYLHHLISLTNLFEPIPKEIFSATKPDIVCLFGIDNTEFDLNIYHDIQKDIFIGLINHSDKNDYFGYMKKMLLTLHNLMMIEKKALPVHGAMVQILLSDNSYKNVVIMGDSGAGKSETLEALRSLGSNRIKAMKTIFDDMGVFFNSDKGIVACGTEIGAFVRLDDLEDGYVYQEIDRAIFINPHKKNARVVLPVSNYEFITDFHHVDYLFYANNYDEDNDGLSLFKDKDEAINYFSLGKRKAKGTTSEKGITTSFFANPFGPLQRQKETNILINDFFSSLYENSIPVGILYTKLAVSNMEHEGPLLAAKSLLKYINLKEK